MFCTRCLRTPVLRRQLPFASTARYLSTSTPLRSAAATGEPQLSTPVTAPGEASQEPISRSICVEGTVITGLNYLKDGKDPVAMKDEEYPEWLWECLDVMKSSKSDEDADDEFCTCPIPLSYWCVFLDGDGLLTV